jgi:hypothetical protein
MKTQLQLTVWLLILCAVWLSGCGEVLNEYYISNHTDSALPVTFTPFYVETVDLSSGPLIGDIQKSARSSLSQPLSFSEEGDTVLFILPAKTTVFLGISTGGNDLFSQLELSSNGQHLVMDRDNYHEYFTVHDNLVGAVVHVLNVE